MMLKQSLVVFSTLLIVSCNYETKKDTEAKSFAQSQVENRQIHTNLIGSWVIRINDLDNCNVCPTIRFSEDQSAAIASSDDSVKIWWAVKDGKLTIKNNGHLELGKIIDEGDYTLKFSRKKDFIDLFLKNVENGSTYTLTK